MTEFLQSKWDKTAARLLLGKTASQKLFAEIVKRHSEAHRKYHGLGHLEALFDVLDPVWDDVSEPARVELAIWYHDIVYKPLRSDNEDKSARLAVRRLSGCGADSGLVTRVARLIQATAHHAGGGADHDDALFLDADFSILGAPADAYDDYAEAIRKEYRLAPRPMYDSGRRKFLEDALNRPRLFHTDHFEARYGAQARENMARELASIGMR